MHNSITYSIIVPVYNVETFLIDCLQSIEAGMSGACECIVVDDGSLDQSGILAERFCSANKLFSYYKKDNGGLSDARNYGLQRAKGKYVIFVDSDDLVSPLLIKVVDSLLQQDNVDAVYYNFIKFHSAKPVDLFDVKLSYVKVRYSDNKALSRMPNFAWARVVKRELYVNNAFPVGVIYEDVVTSPWITQRVKSVAFVSTPLYGYRKRQGSITTTSAEKQFQLFNAVEELNRKRQAGDIQNVIYITAFVNLSQSCIVSLVRLDDKRLRRKYRKLIRVKYSEIPFAELVFSYALWKFKFLSLMFRNSFTLYFLEKIMRPVVLFSDRRHCGDN